jgi:hypothetical protein
MEPEIPMSRTLNINNRVRRRQQRGQSMIEYVIICSVLAICLFATPVGQQLTTALHDFYYYLTFFISLP